MLRLGTVLDLLRAAGPLASLNVAVGVLAAILSLVTVALALRNSKAASITSALCLILVLISIGLGFGGHALAMTAIDAAMGNVPDEQNLMLLHEGTIEARANFRVALACLALPLLTGVLVSLLRRSLPGLALAVLAGAGTAALVVELNEPLPSTEPQLSTPPGFEIPESKSARPLRVSVRLALTPDGAWLDGAKAASIAQAVEGSTSATVLVDRRVTFGPLLELLQAMSGRGAHAVQLVVQGPGGTRTVITVLDAPYEPGPNPMLLTLFISPERLDVGSGNNRLPSLPRDWSALQQKLAEIKATFPTHRFLRIGASPETTVGELVAALDAARPFEELVVGAFELPVVRPELPPVTPPETLRPAGKMRVDVPQVDDPTAIDPELLRRYVRSREGAISACVERSERITDPLTIEVVISPVGRAAELSFTPGLPPSLERCLRDAVSQWVFPFKPASDVRVVLPFAP